MNQKIVILIFCTFSLLLIRCNSAHSDKKLDTTKIVHEKELNLLTDIKPLLENGEVKAVLRIQSSSIINPRLIVINKLYLSN